MHIIVSSRKELEQLVEHVPHVSRRIFVELVVADPHRPSWGRDWGAYLRRLDVYASVTRQSLVRR